MGSRLKPKKTTQARKASRKSAVDIIAYRIGDSRFPLFDGKGAMMKGARWNSPGQPAIYASLSQSCAMLEILAYANTGRVPKQHKLISIQIPKTLAIEKVDPRQMPGWHHRNQKISRRFGDQWLAEKRSVALIVPSVIAIHDHNIIINPLHSDITKISIGRPENIRWDERLFNKPREKN